VAATSAVLVLAATVPAAGTIPASAKTEPKPPTQAQIRAALRRAESSPRLWATVNVCDTKHHPGVIGIRAQMPALGFAATLRMRFEIDYWSVAAKTFKRVPGTTQPVSLGVKKTGLQQEGVQFSFPRHSGTLRGSVRFEWDYGHRVLGRATHATTRGHRDADFGDPAHYSASQCVIR
jgi:hypothetical protein